MHGVLYWTDEYRIRLGPLSEAPARELVEICIQRFGLGSLDLEGFREDVLHLSGHLPGSIVKMCELAADPRYHYGDQVKLKLVHVDYLLQGNRFPSLVPGSTVMNAARSDRQTIVQDVSAENSLHRLADLARGTWLRTGPGRGYGPRATDQRRPLLRGLRRAIQTREIDTVECSAWATGSCPQEFCPSRPCQPLFAMAVRGRARVRFARRNVDGYSPGRPRAIRVRRAESREQEGRCRRRSLFAEPALGARNVFCGYAWPRFRLCGKYGGNTGVRSSH